MAGIYLHIPFCKTRCIYCDFYSTTRSELKTRYVRALCRELAMRKDYLKGEDIETVYFGGGTPSQLEKEDFEQIFDTIRTHYGLSHCQEITLEANPDDLTSEYLKMLSSLPFNRISMGIQTFDDPTLKLLKRRHNAHTAIEAVHRCREAGFQNISIDLIYGLPGETKERWENDLRQAVSLNVEHISAYHLIYEEDTPIYNMLKQHQISEVDEDSSLDFFTLLIKHLQKAGFEHFMIKEILNPENTPERVNELLTLLLGQRVRIVDVLPNDGTRLADESTLLITDMVVQLEDGSIANLEIQKIGYYFPGERSACYSADLLLRQYKRVRGIKGKRFSYRDIKQVYTIVLFEKSPTEFQKFSNNYIHRFMQKSDTGVNINLLQEYLFIPLDIFKKNQQNENRSVKIENRLEAWLAFFCMDDPETIIDIIEKYPDFKEMYEQAYDVCRNIEEVMQMFSKELLELDRNTVKLMIDDMQKEIDCQREQLSQKDEEMLEMRKEIQRLQQLLDKK